MAAALMKDMLKDTQIEIINNKYGKDFVRLLYLRKEKDQHHVKEIEVNTRLQLSNMDEYKSGDNSNIIATDSQKNTVYILAKRNGVETIEIFAQQLSQHFLDEYRHVSGINIYIEEKPWKRVEIGKKQHVHGFISAAEGTKFCRVEQKRNGIPQQWVGIKDMKLMKTTQSSFENFVTDEYCTLPATKDRIFCTVLQAEWCYNSLANLHFDDVWCTVRECILHMFVGPPDTGVLSPSVQKTLYDTCKVVLSKIPQIEDIKIVLPNVHAYEFDLTKFGYNKNGEVFAPADKPSGNIEATVRRRLPVRSSL